MVDRKRKFLYKLYSLRLKHKDFSVVCYPQHNHLTYQGIQKSKNHKLKFYIVEQFTFIVLLLLHTVKGEGYN